VRLNDTDPTIIYSGWIQVMGEQYTDQGSIGIGISIDGGTQQTISTLPSDGQRHSNVAVYIATGLTPGNHTIVVTKLSGTYTTLDGFTITDS
jgi:pantoate kinase